MKRSNRNNNSLGDTAAFMALMAAVGFALPLIILALFLLKAWLS